MYLSYDRYALCQSLGNVSLYIGCHIAPIMHVIKDAGGLVSIQQTVFSNAREGSFNFMDFIIQIRQIPAVTSPPLSYFVLRLKLFRGSWGC